MHVRPLKLRILPIAFVLPLNASACSFEAPVSLDGLGRIDSDDVSTPIHCVTWLATGAPVVHGCH